MTVLFNTPGQSLKTFLRKYYRLTLVSRVAGFQANEDFVKSSCMVHFLVLLHKPVKIE